MQNLLQEHAARKERRGQADGPEEQSQTPNREAAAEVGAAVGAAETPAATGAEVQKEAGAEEEAEDDRPEKAIALGINIGDIVQFSMKLKGNRSIYKGMKAKIIDLLTNDAKCITISTTPTQLKMPYTNLNLVGEIAATPPVSQEEPGKEADAAMVDPVQPQAPAVEPGTVEEPPKKKVKVDGGVLPVATPLKTSPGKAWQTANDLFSDDDEDKAVVAAEQVGAPA